jgi:3-oxoacyl-[acyl-carrier-protein] synthase III
VNNVFITDIQSYLPNKPISNDEIESVLGLVNGKPSRAKSLVLRSNGIRTRYYVLDPATRQPLFSNAELTAESVRKLNSSHFPIDTIDCLVCGTSTPDQLMPNHGVMVQGELKHPPCEVVGISGICLSGIMALKYGYMAVITGQSKNAVTTGSEVASTFLVNSSFKSEPDDRVSELVLDPGMAFDKDFLRWMLSDGAGAILLEPEPRSGSLSLRINWIEQLSYAGETEACMYSGALKEPDGRLKGWREFTDNADIMRKSLFAIRQDVKLLNRHIIDYTVTKPLRVIMEKHDLRSEDIDYLVPHYSSQYFRKRTIEAFQQAGINVPEDRYFTNLQTCGNTGAASIYISLAELFHSGRIRKGQNILCAIPESGRFSVAYFHLTAV